MSTKEETKAPAIVMLSVKDVDPTLFPEPVRIRPEKEDAEELTNLAADVKKHGVRMPIEVAVDPASEKSTVKKYGIVAGRRRFRAAGLAGLKFVPCIVVTADDRIGKTVRENTLRKDYSQGEEALMVARRHMAGEQIKDIAASMGKSVPTVSNLGRIGRSGYAPVLEKRIASGKPLPSWGTLVAILEHAKDEKTVEARAKAELKAFDEACDVLDGLAARVAPGGVPAPQGGEGGGGEGGGEGGAVGGIPVRNGKHLNEYVKLLLETTKAAPGKYPQLEGAAAALQWAMYALPADLRSDKEDANSAPFLPYTPPKRGAPKKEKPEAAPAPDTSKAKNDGKKGNKK